MWPRDNGPMSLFASRRSTEQGRPLMHFLRYWLPALIAVAGVVIAAARGFDDTGFDAMAAMFGAAGALFLMNLLMRVGLVGDDDRDAEDEARAYFDAHGHWPDEAR